MPNRAVVTSAICWPCRISVSTDTDNVLFSKPLRIVSQLNLNNYTDTLNTSVTCAPGDNAHLCTNYATPSLFLPCSAWRNAFQMSHVPDYCCTEPRDALYALDCVRECFLCTNECKRNATSVACSLCGMFCGLIR